MVYQYALNYHLLPLPQITIMVNSSQFTRIIQAFQDLRYIGEMRQRWEEIKKLQLSNISALIV